jgi:hypothetical protein
VKEERSGCQVGEKVECFAVRGRRLASFGRLVCLVVERDWRFEGIYYKNFVWLKGFPSVVLETLQMVKDYRAEPPVPFLAFEDRR